MNHDNKPHWLRFRMEHLEPVLNGVKTHTLRSWQPRFDPGQIPYFAPGDPLLLAFGRHDRPVLVEATLIGIHEIGLDDKDFSFGADPRHLAALEKAGVDLEDLRGWMIRYDPMIFGAIWFRDARLAPDPARYAKKFSLYASGQTHDRITSPLT